MRSTSFDLWVFLSFVTEVGNHTVRDRHVWLLDWILPRQSGKWIPILSSHLKLILTNLNSKNVAINKHSPYWWLGFHAGLPNTIYTRYGNLQMHMPISALYTSNNCIHDTCWLVDLPVNQTSYTVLPSLK